MPPASTRSPTRRSAVFCESVEAAHAAHSVQAGIASRLGITAPSFRIDSQCKYAVVARGEASIYLRLPRDTSYREKVWDHAAGALVLEEAGGRVSDLDGRPLDFSRGPVAWQPPRHCLPPTARSTTRSSPPAAPSWGSRKVYRQKKHRVTAFFREVSVCRPLLPAYSWPIPPVSNLRRR